LLYSNQETLDKFNLKKHTMLKKSKFLLGALAVSSFFLMSFIIYDNYNMLVPDSAFTSPKNLEKIISSSGKKTALFNVTAVVTAAQTFKTTLSTTQVNTLQKAYTTTLARKWSNLPCGSGCRNGIQFSTLSTAQLAAAKAVIQAAMGTASNQGYDVFTQILKADDYLNASGGRSGYSYSSGIYFISFLNEPSVTGAWMLQFGGHHMAYNIAFNNGNVVGTTPVMIGVEPTTWTTSGTTYAPLTARHDAFTAMLSSLTTSQLASAKLTTTFSDCLMYPGESNGNTNIMPTTKQGIACSTLATAQQNLVLAAIQKYVADMDSDTATALMSIYTNELSSTYIAWTGSGTAGTASTFLNANTNYVRIDGPSVWIEFVCQNGFVFSSQIHYHSVWRDHVRDYGADLTRTALGTTEVKGNTVSSVKIYPNPTSEVLNIQVEKSLSNANVSVFDGSGKLLISTKNVSGKTVNIPVSTLNKGNYIIMVSDVNQKFSAKFIKKYNC
jgi:hypothetical protein